MCIWRHGLTVGQIASIITAVVYDVREKCDLVTFDMRSGDGASCAKRKIQKRHDTLISHDLPGLQLYNLGLDLDLEFRSGNMLNQQINLHSV